MRSLVVFVLLGTACGAQAEESVMESLLVSNRVVSERMRDPEFRRLRDAAIQRLRDNRGLFNYYTEGKLKSAGIEWKLVWGIDFDVGAIEGSGPEIVPDTVTDELLNSTLPYLPEILSIKLPMTSVTSHGLRVLASLPELRTIKIYTDNKDRFPSKVGDDAMEHVAACQHLTRLILRGLPITDNGLRHLSYHPTLQFVELDALDITGDSLIRLATVKRLKTIVIDIKSVGLMSPDESLPDPPLPLAVSRAIERMGTRISSFGSDSAPRSVIRAIGSLDSVESLCVEDCDLEESDIVAIFGNRTKRLDCLRIAQDLVTPTTLEAMSKLPPEGLNGKTFTEVMKKSK